MEVLLSLSLMTEFLAEKRRSLFYRIIALFVIFASVTLLIKRGKCAKFTSLENEH